MKKYNKAIALLTFKLQHLEERNNLLEKQARHHDRVHEKYHAMVNNARVLTADVVRAHTEITRLTEENARKDRIVRTLYEPGNPGNRYIGKEMLEEMLEVLK